MSMRSDETVNVGAVAAMFSGGGHVCAAGCGLAAKTQKKLEAETDRLIEAVRSAIDGVNSGTDELK